MDLVIAGDPGDPATILYQPRGVAVSEAGDVYVLDAGDKRIQVVRRVRRLRAEHR